MNFRKVVKQELSYLAKLPLRFYNYLLREKGLIKNMIIVLMIVFIICGGIFILWAANLKTPDLNSFDSRLAGVSTKIYDRTGTVLLYDVNQQVRRTVVPFDAISPYLKDATISIEDEGFYKHDGIQITSIIRAFFIDLATLRFDQGGSTITQQVIKNSLLTSDKTISRKLKEWVLAIKLERTASKDFILNLYLNQTPYGGNIYGVEEASKAFFGKSSADVDIAEAAYIAAVAQAPTYYSPFGSHVADLEQRKNLVLKKMYSNGYITEDQYTSAKNEKVQFEPKATSSLKAPHFVMFILDYLDKKYGEDAVDSGGLKVITTLDYNMESQAEDIVKNYVETNQKKLGAENGALVAIDPKSGQILTMVGSRDYFDNTIQGNFNVATAHRQPGSSFKIFTYATAFNEGYTPDTILFDTKTEFNTSCSPDGIPLSSNVTCYHPTNYEGGYKGPMTMRQALAQSRNIPAVKTLYLAGIEQTLDTAKAFGIQGLGEANDYGLSLTLGSAEVSLLDMTSAYGTFGNNGYRNPYTGILSVQDKNGNTLEQFATSTQQVYPLQPVLEINDVLSDAVARNAIFKLNYIQGRKVALKTGTTNDSRDAWIIGYTPNISVGVWMGNNDNHPMAQIASALIVGPLWQQFMNDVALKNLPVENFTPPQPVDQTIKPVLRGVLDTTNLHDILYYVNRDDPLGPVPTNPTDDPEYVNWEYGVQNWAASNGYNITPPYVPPSASVSTTTSTTTY